MEDLCGIAQYCRATSFKRSEPNVANCLHWLGLSAISIFYVFHKLNRLTFAAKKCCSLQNTPFHMRSPVLLGQAAHSTRGTCHCNGGKPACTRACAKKTCFNRFEKVSAMQNRTNSLCFQFQRTKTPTAPRAASSPQRSPWRPWPRIVSKATTRVSLGSYEELSCLCLYQFISSIVLYNIII